MRVVILGTGTSAGVPTLGCKCPVCTSSNPRNKRLRASAYIEAGGYRLLIDCGADFRTQALAHGIDDLDFVLMTHAHADHLNGLDDLRAFNLVHGHRVDVYALEDTLEEIRRRFGYCFRPMPPGGGVPEIDLHAIDGCIRIGPLAILPVPVFHGQNSIVGFRIDRFAYLTDVSAIPEASVELLTGLDVLVTSALRRRPHPTHMSLEQAVDTATRIGAKHTWLTHMCHDLEHETTNAHLPANIQLAWDGLTFEL